MKNEFKVYFRTGDALNFQWQFIADLFSREDAIAKMRELEVAGHVAHYAPARLADVIGLPETFSASDSVCPMEA